MVYLPFTARCNNERPGTGWLRRTAMCLVAFALPLAPTYHRLPISLYGLYHKARTQTRQTAVGTAVPVSIPPVLSARPCCPVVSWRLLLGDSSPSPLTRADRITFVGHNAENRSPSCKKERIHIWHTLLFSVCFSKRGSAGRPVMPPAGPAFSPMRWAERQSRCGKTGTQRR